jgi:ribonuclease Z
VFAQTRPKLAMLTHLVLLPPAPMPISDVVAELAEEYDGIVMVAEDLMTIEIGRNITVTPFHHGARPK